MRLGVAGPVGAGKSSIIVQLCRRLGVDLSVAVITNGSGQDAMLIRAAVQMNPDRVRTVQTCAGPRSAIREDITANTDAAEDLEADHGPLDLMLLEPGVDDVASTFSPALVDTQLFVVDTTGGIALIRAGGPGIERADLLVLNKIDLAEQAGVDTRRMLGEATRARRGRPAIAMHHSDPVGLARLESWVTTRLADFRGGTLLPNDPAANYY